MYDARFLPSLADVSARDWDALHDGRNPFVSHAFLHGLESQGCLRRDWGWTPHHLTLWEGDTLVAAAPGYLKDNSHGEFVFDHAWAHAYARYGLDYYPKWLCAVPYSPVTGPRLLAQDAAHRKALLTAVRDEVLRLGLSSAHVNFHAEDEDDAFASDWLPRIDVQYHWRNPGHWRDFDGFLADFDHKHRKNIRQERAKVQRTGVVIRTVHGDEATAADLEAMFGFYLRTFQDYGNSPALTLPFLQHLAQTMPRQLVMFLADHDGRTIAGALCLRGHDTLYGRYWGAEAPLPGLHFETCYYQGIEYCLREGLKVFEPGAQGEHKLARGYLPVQTHSLHWIADPGFRKAVARYLDAERRAVGEEIEVLTAYGPFRRGEAQE